MTRKISTNEKIKKGIIFGDGEQSPFLDDGDYFKLDKNRNNNIDYSVDKNEKTFYSFTEIFDDVMARSDGQLNLTKNNKYNQLTKLGEIVENKAQEVEIESKFSMNFNDDKFFIENINFINSNREVRVDHLRKLIIGIAGDGTPMPITLIKIKSDGKYIYIAADGQHRLCALYILNYNIPVNVVNLSEDKGLNDVISIIKRINTNQKNWGTKDFLKNTLKTEGHHELFDTYKYYDNNFVSPSNLKIYLISNGKIRDYNKFINMKKDELDALDLPSGMEIFQNIEKTKDHLERIGKKIGIKLPNEILRGYFNFLCKNEIILVEDEFIKFFEGMEYNTNVPLLTGQHWSFLFQKCYDKFKSTNNQ